MPHTVLYEVRDHVATITLDRPEQRNAIDAVNGAAGGGGCEIVLSCDLIVAAEHARFGLPEVTRGLFATSGGALRLPRLIPRARVAASTDAREGPRAFAEKRPAVWKSR